jgi:hypothetical protein
VLAMAGMRWRDDEVFGLCRSMHEGGRSAGGCPGQTRTSASWLSSTDHTGEERRMCV